MREIHLQILIARGHPHPLLVLVSLLVEPIGVHLEKALGVKLALVDLTIIPGLRLHYIP